MKNVDRNCEKETCSALFCEIWENRSVGEVCDVTTGKTRDRWDKERPEVDEPMKDGEKLCCVVYDCSVEEYRKQYWYRTTKIEKGGQTWTHTLFDKVILKFLATWREWSCCPTFRDLQQRVSICLLGHLYAVIKPSTGSYLLVFFCLFPQIRLLFATYSSSCLIIIIISPQTVTVCFWFSDKLSVFSLTPFKKCVLQWNLGLRT